MHVVGLLGFATSIYTNGASKIGILSITEGHASSPLYPTYVYFHQGHLVLHIYFICVNVFPL